MQKKNKSIDTKEPFEEKEIVFMSSSLEKRISYENKEVFFKLSGNKHDFFIKKFKFCNKKNKINITLYVDEKCFSGAISGMFSDLFLYDNNNKVIFEASLLNEKHNVTFKNINNNYIIKYKWRKNEWYRI